MHADLRAIVDPFNRGSLVEPDPERLRRSRFAQCQVEWMKMARAHVDQAAHIAIGADDLAHGLLWYPS